MNYNVLSRDELLDLYEMLDICINNFPSKTLLDKLTRTIMRRECSVFRIFEILKELE